MATNNQLNVPLSGATGTVNFAGSTSPTFVTPVLGAAALTSLTFSSTTGYVGTTTNNNAAAGSVGEFISATSAGGSLTSTIVSNITSISLTAGDWDVVGTVVMSLAGGTTSTLQRMGISTTSATYGTIGAENNTNIWGHSLTGAVSIVLQGCPMRMSLSGTTTVYLLGSATFAVAGITYGGFIGARRVR